MRLPSRVHGDERGATAVIVALTLIALCGVIVLTVDVGQLLFKRRAIDVFEGRYEMTPLGGSRGALGTQLRYTAVIGLRLTPPPAVGSIAVRQNLAAQLQAVAKEIARRGSRPASVSIGR